MLRNYFKIALRNLNRSKVYTLINVLGLTLGIACAILIFALVKYHLSFDTFHSNADRVYRIVTEFQLEDIVYDPGVPSPLGKAFREEYTFAEKVGRVAAYEDQLISIPASGGELKFQEEEGVAFAEPEFFDILDFPLVEGDKNTVLAEPNTAIITERLSRKYFGEQDPVGKTIRLDNKLDYRITGILRDIPVNTDQRQEIYISYSSLKDYDSFAASEVSWGGTSAVRCFVLLKPHISSATVHEAFAAMAQKRYDEQEAEEWLFRLQPLSDIHFNTNFDGYVAKSNLWALAFVGLFLIATACMNFINLATAQALGRSKEIGVRKVLGSRRRQLFWQFITETALIALLAITLAFVLARTALPSVNELFGTQLSLNLFQDIYLLVFMSVLFLVVVFFSGSYPGFMLAGLPPVLAIKGKLSQTYIGGISLRRGLIIMQFAICQLLIIGTIVIANQIRYTNQADLGFQKDAVVMLPLPGIEKSKISTLQSKLSQISGVENTTFCSEAPAGPLALGREMFYDTRTEKENYDIQFKAGDDQYVSAFGLQLIAGRDLHPSDTVREYLINETLAKRLHGSNEEVIGKQANIDNFDGTIVGVVKDFHNKSFHQTIEPVCITTLRVYYRYCAVKINPQILHTSLTAVEKAWQKVYPAHVYKYDFLDDRVARFYEVDYMMLRLIQTFTAIAIIIGCLGLYGLVSFMAAQKTKEVGVRKVLGASVQSIVWLFGKEFTRLLLIAFVIAAPFAWWIMNNWLENFVYRINIGIWIFALAILITLAVAVLTVGYRSVKAALMNPVKSLKSE